MTGTTGLVSNPRYRLGELGELARQQAQIDVNSTQEVVDFLKKTEWRERERKFFCLRTRIPQCLQISPENAQM